MAANSHTVHRPIDLILDRLSAVKQTRPDRWQARCPAHDDRSPSLSLSETSDGTVLIKCWAGCSPIDIVGSVGLQLKDLFPQRFDSLTNRPSRKPRYSPSEVVRTAITESTILELGYQTLKRGETLNAKDEERVELAIVTLDNLREVVS